jgi:hypothetical protein
MNERIIAFFGNFKYEGYLISEDENSYLINDFKEGKIKLPKSQTVLKFLEGRR